MSNIELIKKRIADSIKVKDSILQNEETLSLISTLADTIAECINNGGKLVLCGNGGSASDALHFAGEIVGRFIQERKAWPAIVLNSDVATMTAIANDYGYNEIYSRQVEAHVSSKDLFIGISTSGNSENVYLAALRSREKGAKTAALLGRDGGKIAKISDYPIVVYSNTTARVQECHINIIHILCELVEIKLS